MFDEWLLYLFFGLIILGLISWNVQQRFTLINPRSCPKINGIYGVNAGVEGSPLSGCGTEQREICQFIVDSLSEAITNCNNASNCLAFNFNSSTGVMIYIDPSIGMSNNIDMDVYIKNTR